jgi:hypothetical protein
LLAVSALALLVGALITPLAANPTPMIGTSNNAHHGLIRLRLRAVLMRAPGWPKSMRVVSHRLFVHQTKSM